MSTATAPVHVAPCEHPWHEAVSAAVQRGDGTLVALEDAEGLIWLGKDEDDLVGALHDGIRWVQLRAAGVETWSGQLDRQRTFTSARGIYADVVAEHVVALLFAGARSIPANARANRWERGDERWGRVVRGSTVALVGAGAIGAAVIQGLEPFGVRVVAVTRSGRDVAGAVQSLPVSRLAEALPVSDYVVVAAPATPETKHLIGAPELAAMPSHAWLVNVGRGTLVDTDALVAALANAEIGGAALDVTDPEPLPDDHPLWTEPRALITPHVANPMSAQLERLAVRVEENVRRFAVGEPLLGVVDVEAGY